VNTWRIVLRLLVVNQSHDPKTPTTELLTLFSSRFPGYFRLGRLNPLETWCL